MRQSCYQLNPLLGSILEPAYLPCHAFSTVCQDMRWKPESGHIPRGFLGAEGALEEVELVLVFAEPGDPQPDERHSGIESALRAARFYHSSKRDQFHRNVGYILDLCWPELSFDEQLHKVWMTESVLCSAPVESGRVRHQVEVTCGERYLKQQLALFPRALVVALGRKAQRRLRAIGFTQYLAASAVAPPGGNRPSARLSWDIIPLELAKKRDAQGTSKALAPVNELHRIKSPDKCEASTSGTRDRMHHQLTGPYRVIDTTRLRATEESDPGKWSIWQHIWRCRSFEELSEASPAVAFTRTNRRITWQSEARWALQQGWIEKVETSSA